MQISSSNLFLLFIFFLNKEVALLIYSFQFRIVHIFKFSKLRKFLQIKGFLKLELKLNFS